MTGAGNTRAVGARLQFRAAAGIVMFLWVAYIVVYTSPPGDALGAVLELIPGVLGIATLLAAGFRREDCFLRVAPISRRGLAALGAAFLVPLAPLLPAALSSGWVGFRWMPTLVYAPASGIAQELYFRAVLLPVLIRLLGGKTGRAILLHSLLFGLWHIPRAYMGAPVAPVPAAIAVALVTALTGLGWGWQVQHDKTVVWALAQHVVFLMVMSLFGM